MPAANANRRPLTRPVEIRRAPEPTARASTFEPPAGMIPSTASVVDR